MPEKNIEPKMNCYLKGNLYDDPQVSACLHAGSRKVVVMRGGEYDEEWGARWVVQTPLGEATVSEQDLSPIPDIPPSQTGRGFNVRSFVDLYGSECSIQDSSLATDDAIWLGVDHENSSTGGRMHLSRGQVAALLPLLDHFVRYGGLPEGDD